MICSSERIETTREQGCKKIELKERILNHAVKF